jgi:alcohol dehydrogenase
MISDFIFSIPTRIQFGSGITKQVGSVVRDFLTSRGERSETRGLVVVDPGIKDAPWLMEIFASLGEAGLQYIVFDGVKPNPRDEDVVQAASVVNENKLGVVIAIGGGSAIDTAKTAALLATYGGKVSDYAGWAKVPGPILPIVAIPTTAGSGSEVTCWAVITDTRTHNKLAIGDQNLAPSVAFVDPLLTVSLPAKLTAATGMDVLTHSIEAYLGSLSNPINDVLALESIRLVAANLKRVVTKGDDLDGRQGMMLASSLGGIAINNADVAGVHCLSEGMGSLYDAPHGLLNAILLPYFMVFWQKGSEEKFIHIAEAFSAAPNPSEAVKQVISLNQSFNFPSLVDIGVKNQDLRKLAEIAASNVSNSSNPIPMIDSDYLGILNQAITGQIARTL